MAPNGGVVSVGLNGRNVSLLRVIPVNQSFGNLITYNSNDIDGERMEYTKNYLSLSTIDISLQDIFGNILDLGQTQLTLEVQAWTV